MAIIESSIKIDAPSKTVWDLVSDIDARCHGICGR